MAVLEHKLRRAAGSQAVLEFVGFSTSSGTSISPHANAAVGDFAILFDRASNTDTTIPTSVVPSGWTSHIDHGYVSGSKALRTVLSSKILASTSAVTGMTGTEDKRKIMLVFRLVDGAVATATAHDASYSNGASGTPPTSIVLAASGGAAPIVVMGGNSARAGLTFSASPSLDATQTNSGATLKQEAGYKLCQGAGVDVTLDGGGNNSEELIGIWFELST